MNAEAAVTADDEAALGPAMDKVVAAPPDDIAPAVATAKAEFEANGGMSAEFHAASRQIYRYMQAHCGYADLALTAIEYAFGGLSLEVRRGPVIVTLHNTGKEVHEVLFARIHDRVTETTEELMALPENELGTKVTVVLAAFTLPGETGYAAANLTPGRYIAVCPLPQHNTPYMVLHMFESDNGPPDGAGPPHYMAGMRQEFEVT